MSPQQTNARAWSWPLYVATVKEVLQATSAGFSLVSISDAGRHGDSPRYALLRDGKICEAGRMNQHAAGIAAQKYFGHFMKLDDRTLLYKRKAGV